ncbi:MAG: PDZ domain-containing protein, partial [Gemmatimonadota bacterium]|nr:PDZ domain-containing protein [Gemmatimonadota bacterium]
MVKITLVENRSPAEKAGLEAGDRILSINGEAVEDFIDFYFLAAEPLLKIELGPRKHLPARTLTIERDAARPLLGFGISDGPVRKCRNRCLFCFIDQLPRSLRGSLYIKDEDYRYSFLYGNYITGTGLSDRDIRRIIRMGLQPLFISVHATDPDVRRRMLGNPAAADVMPLLGKLTSGGVGFHLQVVLCVGIN